MADKTISKLEVEDVKSKFYLKVGTANNLNASISNRQMFHRIRIPGKYMKNYERYMSRAVVAADYTPAVIEAEPAISAVSLAALRLEAEKLRSKLTNDTTLCKAFPPTPHAA